jgi:hypothetical protein
MKFTSAILAVCASLSMTAVADNCFKGWMYCGWDLMDKGTKASPSNVVAS